MSNPRNSNPDNGDVALLIDYENLAISLKRHFDVSTPKMSLLIQEAQDRGRLVLARAYAPWTLPELSIDAENLYRQGIDLVYVPSGKNSADVRMAVDAVETSGRAPNIQTYVIVTGDGDLIHPLNYLRQTGRTVIVIGVDAAMSRMLSSAADAVLLYERDLDPSVRHAATPTKSTSKKHPGSQQPEKPAAPRLVPLRGHPSAEEAFAMVRDALTRHGDGEPVLYQELGHWLSEEHGMRPRSWYGVPFSTFMDAARDAGVTVLTTSGGNSYAALPESPNVSLNDDNSDDTDDDGETDTGAAVQLESLRDDERNDLLHSLRELMKSKGGNRVSFRLIVRHLVEGSVLPRLSQRQVRRLLHDLEERDPPILIRSQRRGKDSSGTVRSVTTYALNEDALQAVKL
jgi:uncharacterized protein (TIGR00288 family)